MGKSGTLGSYYKRERKTKYPRAVKKQRVFMDTNQKKGK